MDRRKPDDSVRKVCTWRALIGSTGTLTNISCVDCIVALLGNSTVMLFFVLTKFTNGMLMYI